ncbi:hypothetical protein KY285_027775 [Solanum tuberosum]|nr:hypothetical protein KY285_027775 [Solanum tuberosum]
MSWFHLIKSDCYVRRALLSLVHGVSTVGRSWHLLWCPLWEEYPLGNRVSFWSNKRSSLNPRKIQLLVQSRFLESIEDTSANFKELVLLASAFRRRNPFDKVLVSMFCESKSKNPKTGKFEESNFMAK